MKKLRFLLFTIAIPLFGLAQSDDFETDRPSQSFTPGTTLKKHLQVEAGFKREYDEDEGKHTSEYLYPTALIKYGLLKKLELRVLIEQEADYEHEPEKHKTEAGLLPVKIGAKYNLLEGKGLRPKISILARTDIPKWASPDFKEDFLAPMFRLLFQNKIGEKGAIVYNIGAEWQEDDEHGDFFYSISPQFEIVDKLKVFGEFYSYTSRAHTASNYLDAGLFYQLRPNVQVDLFGGVGISKNTTNNFAEVGLSFRLPN